MSHHEINPFEKPLVKPLHDKVAGLADDMIQLDLDMGAARLKLDRLDMRGAAWGAVRGPNMLPDSTAQRDFLIDVGRAFDAAKGTYR